MLLRDFFTDKTNKADEMALAAIFGLLAYIGLSIFAVVVKGQVFDPQAYGIGLGTAIGGAAAGMGLKSKMENGNGS